MRRIAPMRVERIPARDWMVTNTAMKLAARCSEFWITRKPSVCAKP
jgi:hypothetical protein